MDHHWPSAPAAPVEPLCQCGHGWGLHQAAVCYGRNEVTGKGFCKCNASAPIPPGPSIGDERESYNVCKCGHREAWHDTPHSQTCTGWFGRCECATYEFDHRWTARGDELPDAQMCHAFNTFNKVGCTRLDGHDGAHLHDYGNGFVCGWDRLDRATKENNHE